MAISTRRHDIGQKYNICPNQQRVQCAKCSGPQHESESRGVDRSVSYNFKGIHLATDQHCPARQQNIKILRKNVIPPGSDASTAAVVAGQSPQAVVPLNFLLFRLFCIIYVKVSVAVSIKGARGSSGTSSVNFSFPLISTDGGTNVIIITIITKRTMGRTRPPATAGVRQALPARQANVPSQKRRTSR